MKKIFCAVLCILMLWLNLAGCGDEKYEELQKEYYAGKTAIISLDGNLIAEGKLEKYVGYSNGICILTINGLIFHGGAECFVNELTEDRAINDFTIAGFGLSID